MPEYKYNDQIDQILFDLLQSDSFEESELNFIIQTVTNTIYLFDKQVRRKNLLVIVEHYITNKYKKYYIYDQDSPYNVICNAICNAAEDINSDSPIKEIRTDKISLSSYTDLISHTNDHEGIFTEGEFLIRSARIEQIKKIPQHEQKSDAWLAQRSECLTATAIATALDEDPYAHPIELLLDKCNRGKVFVQNPNVHNGNKFEQIGNMYYAFRNNVAMGEYGLIQDDVYPFIGVSPDGICEPNSLDLNQVASTSLSKLSKLVGRLLEIKFPKSRQIIKSGEIDGGICPHQYFIQVQAQLFVTKMAECDFLQCKAEEYDDVESYILDSDPLIPTLSKKTHLEKGCMIQLLPKKLINIQPEDICLYSSKYIYPPKLHMTMEEIELFVAKETINFESNPLSKEYRIDRVIFWRLTQVQCTLITANTEYFPSIIPKLKQFWDYVLFFRSNPTLLDKIFNLREKIGNDKTAKLFKRVHKFYSRANPETPYSPLYQKTNSWRKKFNEKKKWNN